MSGYISYTVSAGVNVAFTGIMIVPLIAIMCITYGRAPRSKDPARVTVTYFKAMLPIETLGLLLFTIQGILNIVYGSSYFYADIVYSVQIRMSALATLFSYIMDILFIMTLAEMGNGFLFCLAETRTGLQKGMRYVAIGTCTILAMVAIALFGVTNAEYSQYVSNSWYDYNDGLWTARRNISGALTILTFIWALVLVVFAAIVFNRTKRNYVLKNSAMLFLVAAVLNFISHLYMLIYTSIFILANFYTYDSYSTYTALLFIDPILNVWVYVAAISLVCAILIRKNNGLWATLQPWMGAQVPPALAANPSYKGPGEQWHQPSNSHVMGV